MKRLTKEDISQEVFDLYDDYAQNKIERRQFVEKLSLFAVGTLTLPSLLSFMTPNYIDSILIKPGDPRLKSEYITYDSHKPPAPDIPIHRFCITRTQKTQAPAPQKQHCNPYCLS